MRRVTGSNIIVWKQNKGNCFNVKIESLGVLLVVCKKSQPKSYERIESWFNNNEPDAPIMFTPEELLETAQ